MARSTSADGFYAVDKDILERDEAALTCAAVLDVLRGDVTAVSIDAYSDYDQEMPDEIKDIQAALKEIGLTQHKGDPGMGIGLVLSDPAHAHLLDRFAPWSINVDLLGPQGLDMGGFHDCANSVHFRASPEKAAEIAARLIAVGSVVTMSALDERRRKERRARWAGRRTAVRDRARGFAQQVPWIGKTRGWPTITPPTVPPAGPPQFEPDNTEEPREG